MTVFIFPTTALCTRFCIIKTVERRPSDGKESEESEAFAPDGEDTPMETDANGEPIVPTEEPDEEVISFDGGLGLPDDVPGISMEIQPMPETMANLEAPGPGEAVPGEEVPAEQETKPAD